MRGLAAFWVVSALAAALVVAGIAVVAAAAPVVQTVFGYPAGENIYEFLAPICHQFPTRSFWLLERPMAICARCFSMYVAFAIAVLIAVWSTKTSHRIGTAPLVLPVGFAIPLVVDGYLQMATDYESTNVVRFLTGVLFGIAMASLLIRARPLVRLDRA